MIRFVLNLCNVLIKNPWTFLLPFIKDCVLCCFEMKSGPMRWRDEMKISGGIKIIGERLCVEPCEHGGWLTLVWSESEPVSGVFSAKAALLRLALQSAAQTRDTRWIQPSLCDSAMFGQHLHGDASAGGATIRLIWLTEAALCKVLNGNCRTGKIEWFKN